MKTNKKIKNKIITLASLALAIIAVLGILFIKNNASETEEVIDFSSKQILIATDEDGFEDNNAVISSYGNVYLLSYDTEEEAESAYEELSQSYTVFANTASFTVSSAVTNTSRSINYSNSLLIASELEEIDLSGEELVIALIDTGVSESADVLAAVSVTDDDPYDKNGHGTKMYNTITAINPDAKIVSIKAFDENGYATAASIYAALEYAKNIGADIINLSFSATSSDENALVSNSIINAAESGIIVSGAAGNNNDDAYDYIPGGIYEAYIFGAVDSAGELKGNSNYGDSVDGYIKAQTTSYAAAKASGYFSLGYTLSEMIEEGIASLEYGEAYGETVSSDDTFTTATQITGKYDTDCLNSKTVTFSVGSANYYASAFTRTQKVTYTLGSKSYTTSAFCVQPNKATSAVGKYTATKVSNSSSISASDYTFAVITAALLIYEVDELNDIYGSIYTNLSKADSTGGNTYAWCHAVVSYMYCESLYKINSTTLQNMVIAAADKIEGYLSATDSNAKLLQSYVDSATLYRIEVSGTQNFVFVIWSDPDQTGSVSLTKTSASSVTSLSCYSSVIAKSSDYSLAGAKYYVYTDSACTKRYGSVVLTTTSSGTTNSVSLPAGATYYIKEVTASTGYAVSNSSSTGYAAKVYIYDGGGTYSVSVTEKIYKSSFFLKLYKQDENGDRIKQAGVVFKLVYYYKNSSGVYTKAKTLYYETNSSGYINFANEDYLCDDYDNDPWLTGSSGTSNQIWFPIGKVVITEVSAPDGYSNDGYSATIYIKNDSDLENITMSSITTSGDVTISTSSDKTGASTNYCYWTNDSWATANITFMKADYTTSETAGAGFTFRLYGTSDNGTYYNVYDTTEDDGIILFEDIETGTYKLVETAAADGYIISETTYTVTVTDNDEYTISGTSSSSDGTLILTNTEYQGFTVKKTTPSGTLVSGVSFKLTGVSSSVSSYSKTLTTTSSGIVTFSNLEPGNYTLVETSTSSSSPSVVLDSTVHSVTVTASGVTIDSTTLSNGGTYTVTDDVYASFTLSKTNSLTGNVISGVTFKLYGTTSSGEAYSVSKTTTTSGTITFTSIEPGNYKLVETSVGSNSIILDATSRTVTVSSSGEITIEGTSVSNGGTYTIENTPYQSFTLYKVDSTNADSVSGVVFKLYGTSDYGTAVSTSKTTSSSGTITFSNLEPGTYTLIETSVTNADPAVEADTTVHKVVVSATDGITIDGEELSNNTITFKDDLITNLEFSLSKVSSFDNSAVSKVKFTLSGTSDYGNTVNQTQTTDSNGNATFSDLEPGTYYLVESDVSNADPAVIIDTTIHTVVLSSTGTVTIDGASVTNSYEIENTPYSSFSIKKISEADSSVISGVVFRLYGTTSSGSIVDMKETSDSNGLLTFTELEPGTYYLTEYNVDDASVSVSLDSTVRTVIISSSGTITIDGEEIDNEDTITITNTPLASFNLLKINSYDYGAVSGVVFRLYGTSDNGTAYDISKTTSSTGKISFTDIEPGTYCLVETDVTDADPAVILDSTIHVVVIDTDTTVSIDGEALSSSNTLTLTNTRKPTGTISVIKKWVGSDLSSLYDDDGNPILFPTIYLESVEDQ